MFGWYTIDAANRPCDEAAWGAAAVARAAREGVDTGRATITWSSSFPPPTPAPSGARVNIRASQTWINGTSIAAFTHELGHNLGTPHASSRTCTGPDGQRVVLGETCVDIEYGNPFDVMGAGLRHTNAYNKAQAGWLPAASVRRVEEGGRFTLRPQEQPARRGRSCSRCSRDASTFYYLEYRQPFGFDSFAPDDPITQGVIVLLGGPPGEVARTFLLDLTPETDTLADAPSVRTGRTGTSRRG